MIGWKLSGLVGAAVVVAFGAVGFWSFASNYALASAGEYLAPTLASLVITAAVVFGLFVLGARSDRWLGTPYW
ncbi:hypothetical protein [Salinilacihabitans rarus]|uniref:hypothetical protein n=1 Tax=Salinilacihabitans rarus TaxID=2961596 RepID=UPI0020C93446|nr:hypothetical protein [Salinilacihabitans rarus]